MKTSNPRGQRREETFENILRNPLTFPAKPLVSEAAQDLITKLLIKDVNKRVRVCFQRLFRACAAVASGVCVRHLRYAGVFAGTATVGLSPHRHPSPFSTSLPPAQLGTKAGAEEIKSHPFFEGVNWALLRQVKPPYVPRRASAPPAGDAPGKGGAGFDNY
jgi:hypothetical protein